MGYELKSLTYLALMVATLGGDWTNATTPTATEVATLVAGGAVTSNYNTLFGYSVAIDGDTAIVGAIDEPSPDVGFPSFSGAVYVYTRSNGVWSLQQRIVPDARIRSGNGFGRSLAIDGDTAVISAPMCPSDNSGSAVVYFYVRNSGVWSLQERFGGPCSRGYGAAVALDGDTALVSSPGENYNNGVVFAFARINGTWTGYQVLEPSALTPTIRFGTVLALDGGTALIGVPSDSDIGVGAGAAYVFKTVDGVWRQQQKLLASDGGANGAFGYAVDVQGSTALVGAYWGDANGFGPGSAYVFTEGGGAWTQQQKLVASDGTPGDNFGLSVALDGNKIVIASYGDDDNGTDSGSAYVYERSGTTWAESIKLLASDGAPYDHFGGAFQGVSLSGGTVLVGAPYHDSIGSDDGAAYIFSTDMLAGLTLNYTTVAGCKSVTGKVTLAAPAPAGGVLVSLVDSLAAASTPVSVSVPAGATTKTFTVKTVPVVAQEIGAVTATLGASKLEQSLVVRPMGLLSVALTPSTVVGTKAVTGKATLECMAGPGPVTVDLASSNASVASPVSANIVVPQALQSAPFDVTTSRVLSKTTATISGTANGIKKSKVLTVTAAAVVSPTSLKFASRKVGTTSAPLNVTLSNKGAIAFSVTNIGITGTNASSFTQSNSCPSTLSAGASCVIGVRFKPTATGSKTAKVTIATTATSTALSVSLSGTGTL